MGVAYLGKCLLQLTASLTHPMNHRTLTLLNDMNISGNFLTIMV